MADLPLIEASRAAPARLSIAHQVAINALAAHLVPPIRRAEMTPLFLAELRDALDQLRGTEAPGYAQRVIDAGRNLLRVLDQPDSGREALGSAEWEGRLALGAFFYWRLAGASDALKNGAANAPA